MPNRITKRDLQARIDWLNKLTGNPLKPYQDTEVLKANPGNYHLDSTYGGLWLAQMSKDGRIRKIIGGFYPKRELYEILNAYIAGIEDSKKGRV